MMRWLALAMLASVLTFPRQALAHGLLKSSTPTAGAHLVNAPGAIVLTFSESPSMSLTSMRLVAPDGSDVALGAITRDTSADFSITAAVSVALTSGVYAVHWQMAGDDGHPTRGSFQFTLSLPQSMAGSPMEADQIHENPISQPISAAFDVESPAYVAIRWLQYGALVVLIGAVAFALVVLARVQPMADALLTVPDARARAARIAIWATLLLGATALFRLFAQSYALHGVSLAPDIPLIGTLLRVTQWGQAWVLEMVAVLVALYAFRRARAGSLAAWRVAAACACAIVLAMALSGHAAASPKLLTLAILADSLHILGAGGWLGSLLFVILAGVPATLAVDPALRWRTVANLVDAFSPTALVFAALTAITGVFAAWLHIENIPALWQTRYGQVLLLKLAVLSVTAGIGLYNWQRVTPILDAGPDGTRRLKRSAVAELGVGILVLLLTAVLVATPTGMDM